MPVASPENEILDRNPRFRRLADYLKAKAPPGLLPGRQHIDPLDIPDLLPYLLLMDVIRQPNGSLRYRLRLVGTAVAELQGEDATGKYADEVLTLGAEVIAGYRDILLAKKPQYRKGEVAMIGRDHVRYERVAFPLAADGVNVDMLMLCFGLQPAPALP